MLCGVERGRGGRGGGKEEDKEKQEEERGEEKIKKKSNFNSMPLCESHLQYKEF